MLGEQLRFPGADSKVPSPVPVIGSRTKRTTTAMADDEDDGYYSSGDEEPTSTTEPYNYQAKIIRSLQALYLQLNLGPPGGEGGEVGRRLFEPLLLGSTAGPAPPIFGSDLASLLAALGGDTGVSLALEDGLCPPSPCAALLYLPTGGGKTRVAAELAKWMVAIGGRVLFVAHRNVLVEQAERAMLQLLPKNQVRVVGEAGKETARVKIATVQMLNQEETPLPPFDLLILDEAHAAVAPIFSKLWTAAASGASGDPRAIALASTGGERLECSHRRPLVVGLTATPTRLNKAVDLGGFFDLLVVGPSITGLIEADKLVPPEWVRGDIPGLREAIRRPSGRSASRSPPPNTGHLDAGGFFDGDECGEDASNAEACGGVLRNDEVLDSIVEKWKQHCSGRSTLVFSPTVEASVAVCAAFVRHRVTAKHVDSKTAERDREQAYLDLANGTTTVLASVGLLSEGFDEPRVSAVVLLRPTANKGLLLQQVGRGLRLCEGKRNCVVLDFVEAEATHGSIFNPLPIAALAGRGGEGGEGGGGGGGGGGGASSGGGGSGGGGDSSGPSGSGPTLTEAALRLSHLQGRARAAQAELDALQGEYKASWEAKRALLTAALKKP